MTVWADYKLYVDWNNDGDFSDTYENITSYIKGAITIRQGRDQASTLTGKCTAGKLTVTLDNSSKIFSRYNTSSPLVGLLKKGKRVKLTMKIGAGAEVTKFIGIIDGLPEAFGETRNDYLVNLSAIGPLGMMAKVKNVNIPMIESATAADAIHAVLDAAEWSETDRDIATGESTWPRYWTGGEITALQALRDVEDSEGGFLHEGQEGEIIYEGRSYRFTGDRLTSQATYSCDPAANIRYKSIQPLDTDDAVFNYIEAFVRTFNLSELKVLCSLVDIYATNGNVGSAILIPAGQGSILDLTFPTVNSSNNEIAVSSWGTVTAEANSAADGTGTDETANILISRTEYDNKLSVEVYNPTDADIYIVVLKADGIAIVQGDGFLVSAKDADSIQDCGKLPWRNPAKFLTTAQEAQAFCDYHLSIFKDPRDAVNIVIDCNTNSYHQAEAQIRKISDRITIVTEDGLSGDYFVENIIHKIYGNDLHEMTLLCTKVTGTEWAASDIDYTPSTVPTTPDPSVPDQLLWTTAIALQSSILFTCGAEKFNAGIIEAEFRAKRLASGTAVKSVDLRTVAEGGTFEHNGNDQIIVTEAFANWTGFKYEHFYGAYAGDWYWAIRLKNDKGWSNWTDGNPFPQYVVDNINTNQTIYDIGPAQGWTAKIQAGVQDNTAVVVATRPPTNGRRILSAAFQIRDATAGSWRSLDSDSGAADTLYDGSLIDHYYNPLTGELRKLTGNYGDAATTGGLLLIDVRQSNFDHRCCAWIEVSPEQFASNIITGIPKFIAAFAADGNGEFDKLRIKIVKAPWSWNGTTPAANTDGFQEGAGFYKESYITSKSIGDLTSELFTSAPFIIPTGKTIADLEAKVWFENTYSTSDNDYYTDVVVDSAAVTTIPMVLWGHAHGITATPPTEGPWAMIKIPCNLYLEGISVIADQAGSCEWDVRMCTVGSLPADSGDTIVGTNPPALSSQIAYEDFNLAGWNRNLIEGDSLILYLKSGATSVLDVTINLICTKILTIGTGAEPGTATLPTPWAYWPLDEIADFTVPTVPGIWFAAGGLEAARTIWAKITFALEAGAESLANGSASGPLFIPSSHLLRAFWKDYLAAIAATTEYGAKSGTPYVDSQASSLDYVRVCGFRAGEDDSLHYIQLQYEKSDGTKVWGTLNGASKGNTHHYEYEFDDDEYVVEIRGSYRKSYYSSAALFIDCLIIETNKDTYTINTLKSPTYTISFSLTGTNSSYEFVGFKGYYKPGDRINSISAILRQRTFNTATITPDRVTGWNLYTSLDGINFFKKSETTLALDEIYEE